MDIRYRNANIKSTKEFIQRMLDGWRLYDVNQRVCYFFGGYDFLIDPMDHDSKMQIRPVFVPNRIHNYYDLQIKEEMSIHDMLSERPLLCWVWDGEHMSSEKELRIVSNNPNLKYPFVAIDTAGYRSAEIPTLDEVKRYLWERS